MFVDIIVTRLHACSKRQCGRASSLDQVRNARRWVSVNALSSSRVSGPLAAWSQVTGNAGA